MRVAVVSHTLSVAVLVSALLFGAGQAAAQTPTPTPGGDCCSVHAGPECDIPACVACVCDLPGEAKCCIGGWDAFCVAAAEDAKECATECGCGGTPTPTPTPGGDCCSPHSGTGCDLAACQGCVCGVDGFCCTGEWDPSCVAVASDECGDSCPCLGEPTPTPTPGGNCCTEHAGAQCDDQTCEECVCGLDPACCSTGWDQACADEAAIECALSCTECGAPGDCCTPHGGVSCAEARCKTCVCALDPVCCTEEWDERCVEIATADCPVDCPCEEAGGCCEPHDGLGCDDIVCQDCVCALDPLCCTEIWDERCAEEAAVDCGERCAECISDDCCVPSDEPGCVEPICEDCVCNVDPFCCDEFWDDGCVIIATEDCPGECLCGDVPTCPGDCNGDGTVTINELIAAVGAAANGCG